MKKLAYLIAVVLPTLSHARVYTLCNMAYCQPSAFVFNTFDNAQNAASDGDTIYVQGSSISYGNIFIARQLTLIGAGHHPNKQNTLTSPFIHIAFGNSNIQLIGLTFSHMDASGVYNCVVKKCHITGEPSWNPIRLFNPVGWLFQGNVIESADPFQNCFDISSTANNLIIENNLISSAAPKIANIGNSASDRSYILNNVFLGNNTNTSLRQLSYTNIENNIFVADLGPDDTFSFTLCVMNNNISYSCTDNSFHVPGINNLVNANPQFGSFPGGFFSYTYDFSLNAASPGHNTGTDGTDRGVFGGVGFKFTTTGEPAISEVSALTITSPTTVAPGGNITISLTSKSVH